MALATVPAKTGAFKTSVVTVEAGDALGVMVWMVTEAGEVASMVGPVEEEEDGEVLPTGQDPTAAITGAAIDSGRVVPVAMPTLA